MCRGIAGGIIAPNYTVRDYLCGYGVFRNNEVVIILNSKENAELIAEIIKADINKQTHHSTTLWKRYTGERDEADL